MPRHDQPQQSERTEAAAGLQQQVKALAGVSDVLRIYGQIEETLETVNTFRPQELVTSGAGNRTA